MPRCFENGNGDFGPEAFRAIHCAQLSTNKWSRGFMVLDVSYSRVLGQRPTFSCPLVFFTKNAIRRRQFAAIDCDVFMCGSYRIAGSELPRTTSKSMPMAPYSIALETLCIAKCCKSNIELTCTYFNPAHGFFTS